MAAPGPEYGKWRGVAVQGPCTLTQEKCLKPMLPGISLAAWMVMLQPTVFPKAYFKWEKKLWARPRVGPAGGGGDPFWVHSRGGSETEA